MNSNNKENKTEIGTTTTTTMMMMMMIVIQPIRLTYALQDVCLKQVCPFRFAVELYNTGDRDGDKGSVII